MIAAEKHIQSVISSIKFLNVLRTEFELLRVQQHNSELRKTVNYFSGTGPTVLQYLANRT